MLVSFKEILQDAFRGHYAVGAFNCLSLEHVLGVIEAAEELRSPVILQLAEVQFPYSPLELMAPMFLDRAARASVPVAVHLDHGQSFETCVRAVKIGFNSVMFDGACLPFEDNVRETSAVARMAKAVGVDVEAELGKVGNTSFGTGDSEDHPDVFTDVEESARFVELTGVDALAIAIGNLHGRYVATPKLNIQRLKEISARNNMPLVLHGGSGTSDEDFKACAHNGISKINVATSLQMAVTAKVQDYLAAAANPDYITMKHVMKDATKEAVIRHMLLFESDGKA
ncbi:MAG: class II fructose-bisphosphate aldolase [Bacteroidales bacterium]|nr:class II fructose-bisphosphate aldolase [Bacteroidales bacterium]